MWARAWGGLVRGGERCIHYLIWDVFSFLLSHFLLHIRGKKEKEAKRVKSCQWARLKTSKIHSAFPICWLTLRDSWGPENKIAITFLFGFYQKKSKCGTLATVSYGDADNRAWKRRINLSLKGLWSIVHRWDEHLFTLKWWNYAKFPLSFFCDI